MHRNLFSKYPLSYHLMMDKSKEKDKEITELRQAGKVYITNSCSYMVKLENLWFKGRCSFSYDGGAVNWDI